MNKIKNLFQQKYKLLTKRRANEYETPLIDSYNTIFTATVTIGTPGQEFNVVIDTGSTSFWVLDSSCCQSNSEENGDSIVNKFDSSSSSTFLTTNTEFECRYADGTFSEGLLGIDKLKFGSKNDPNTFTVPTALIGLASDAQSGGSMFELKIDGIFGLGPPRSDDLCGFESPLYTAYKNKLINKSIFSVYMHNSKDSGNGEYGGDITFGAIDKEHCGSPVHWVKAHNSIYWRFRLDSLSHKGNSIDIKSKEAISDTGSSLISGPKTAVKHIYDSIGDIEIYEGMILIPCDKDFEPVVFTIDGMDFKLGKEVLTIRNEDIGDEFCEFGIASGGSELWIFGDPFIRKYCTVYDFGQRKIGFVAQKQ
uniref:Peptidase A1 domain-containing protein n=1 Tax=Meloidogyne incognita TaxID=6306 RepID=A0A914L956_MELIC